ncbi:ferric/cupric-chelate reductase [Kappamyces sp. JEL0680]|nr:ferric/cupric-chelate reductase [Kappamyces sp. JEL0680]
MVWTAAGVYFLLCASFLLLYRYLPLNLQVFLQSEVYPLKKLRIRQGWTSRKFFCITYLDLLHMSLVFALLGYSFGIYYRDYFNNFVAKGYTGKAANWKKGAMELYSFSMGAAHWCDLLIALNLIPLSRHSFLATVLNLSSGASIRYHQITGNLLVIATVLHAIVGYSIHITLTADNLWNNLFLINSKRITWSSLCLPFGVASLLIVFLIRLTSLPLLRRRFYSIFLVFHYFLIAPLIVFTYLHAANNLYWTVPALGLYILDLVYRFFSFYVLSRRSTITLEPGNMLRVDVYGCKEKALPGQFYQLQVQAVSRVFSHPFSVAGIQDDCISFMVKRQRPASWTDQLFLVRKSVSRVTLDGPFCSPPFEVSRLGCLVSARGIPVYLFWSIRDPSLVHLSFFQELERCQGVTAKVFVTQSDLKIVTVSKHDEAVSAHTKSPDEETIYTPQCDTVDGRFYEKVAGRMNMSLEFANIKQFQGTTGVYICGPTQFMADAELVCDEYPTFLPYRETYEW